MMRSRRDVRQGAKPEPKRKLMAQGARAGPKMWKVAQEAKPEPKKSKELVCQSGKKRPKWDVAVQGAEATL